MLGKFNINSHYAASADCRAAAAHSVGYVTFAQTLYSGVDTRDSLQKKSKHHVGTTIDD
jgi:hypothetical protein